VARGPNEGPLGLRNREAERVPDFTRQYFVETNQAREDRQAGRIG
jgi:hypothetical protein